MMTFGDLEVGDMLVRIETSSVVFTSHLIIQTDKAKGSRVLSARLDGHTELTCWPMEYMTLKIPGGWAVVRRHG